MKPEHKINIVRKENEQTIKTRTVEMQAKQPRKQLVYQMLRIAQVRLIQTMVHIRKKIPL